MTNGREKSDSAIVAAKPTNKAGATAAELVEPRAGTKRNAGQHNTRRAQDRESVTQALDRVRQAARQRKKEKFTTLFHRTHPLKAALWAGLETASVGDRWSDRRLLRGYVRG